MTVLGPEYIPCGNDCSWTWIHTLWRWPCSWIWSGGSIRPPYTEQLLPCTLHPPSAGPGQSTPQSSWYRTLRTGEEQLMGHWKSKKVHGCINNSQCMQGLRLKPDSLMQTKPLPQLCFQLLLFNYHTLALTCFCTIHLRDHNGNKSMTLCYSCQV